jgi:hypothetical protein
LITACVWPFGNLDLAGIVDVFGDLAKIAHIEPPAATGTFDVVFGLSRCGVFRTQPVWRGTRFASSFGSADRRSRCAGGARRLPLVLQLKLQLFNYLGQPLSCEGVCGLEGEPAGLLQLSFQYHAPHACHLSAPIYPEFFKMCTDTLTIR